MPITHADIRRLKKYKDGAISCHRKTCGGTLPSAAEPLSWLLVLIQLSQLFVDNFIIFCMRFSLSRTVMSGSVWAFIQMGVR